MSFFRSNIETPLGNLTAIADEKKLWLLQFSDQVNLEHDIKMICEHPLTTKKSAPLVSIEQELQAYFAGKLKTWKTPFQLNGSTFQLQAWQGLCAVPFGQTISYAKQAENIGRKRAYRAVGSANGKNLLIIIVPCHRIIASDGGLGGFGAGLERKKWLLAHEEKITRASH